MSDLTVIQGEAINGELARELREARARIAQFETEQESLRTELTLQASLIAALKATHADLQRDLAFTILRQHGVTP